MKTAHTSVSALPRRRVTFHFLFLLLSRPFLRQFSLCGGRQSGGLLAARAPRGPSRGSRGCRRWVLGLSPAGWPRGRRGDGGAAPSAASAGKPLPAGTWRLLPHGNQRADAASSAPTRASWASSTVSIPLPSDPPLVRLNRSSNSLCAVRPGSRTAAAGGRMRGPSTAHGPREDRRPSGRHREGLGAAHSRV